MRPAPAPMRELIQRAGFSPAQIAETLGVEETRVLAWCTGAIEPPLPVLRALRHLAELQLDAVFDYD